MGQKSISDTPSVAADLFADADRLLSRRQELEDLISQIPELIVPRLADGCVVHLKDASGRLCVMAHAHDDPDKSAPLHRWACHYRRSIADTDGVGAVVRSGEPLLVKRMSKDVLSALAPDEEYVRLTESLALRSLIVVPLHVQRERMGALTLIASDPRSYDTNALSAATALADRISIALGDAGVPATITSEVLIDHDAVLLAPHGERYRAQIRGNEMDDGRWEGWIAFISVEGGNVVRTGRETVQPSRAGLVFWASGITPVYLEGALRRAHGTETAGEAATP